MKQKEMMNFKNKYAKAIQLLYSTFGKEVNEELLDIDIEIGYLTDNTGSDGNIYLWYHDGAIDIAINTGTYEIIQDENLTNLLN